MNDERDDHSPGRRPRPHPDGRGTPPPPPRPGPPRPGGDPGRPPQRPAPGPGAGGPAWPGAETRPGGPARRPAPPPGGPQWPAENPDIQDTQKHPPVPPPGQHAPRPGGEPAQERTDAWTPSFDDDDQPDLAKRLNGGDAPTDNRGGRTLDLPTTYAAAPPAGPRQGPRPGPQQNRQPPPPPGDEQPTQHIPQTPADDDRRPSGGAAAAAAGAGMAGAAGGAVRGGDPVPPREPQLLTHQEQGSTYDYYADDHPVDDPYPSYDDDRNDLDGDYDGDDRDPDDLADQDDEMSAKQARRRKLWRRVRRCCYVAVACVVLLPVAVFIYGYLAWDVPDEAKVMSAARPIELQYANGAPLARVEPKGSREIVKNINDVSEVMRNATIAAEDATFRTNPGFDFMGIARSVYFLVTGSGVGGGSTITQQFIKLDLELNKKDPTYVRKIKEVVLAFKMTQQREKDDILLAYLNTAYYGRGADGITAASRAFFNKKPSELNAAEAAMLAGMVQRPRDNDPRVDLEQATTRWNYVVEQMERNGFLQPGERQTMRMPETLPRSEWKSNNRLTPEQDAIWEAIKDELEGHDLSASALSRGGYTIRTTIDPEAQQKAEAAVHAVMDDEPESLRTSLVAVDPKNGGVLAYYGSKKTVGDLDWASRPQQPGSSFKPFVVLAGLEKGRGIGETYDGSSPQTIAGTEFANAPGVRCDVPEHCGIREAMTKSVNTVFVNLANQIGASNVAKAAHQAGIPESTKLANDNGVTEAGIALGMYPVRPVDMAAAYATFVNEGQRVKPHFVAEVTSPETGKLDLDVPEPEPAYGDEETSKDMAFNVGQTLTRVAEHSKAPLSGNRPVVSKTGTHQWGNTTKNQNAWMIGATPQISTAVAMLNDDNGPKPLEDANGESFYGGGLPAKVWQKFMNDYLKGKKVMPLPTGEKIGQFEDTPPPPPPAPTTQPSTTSNPPTSEDDDSSESDKPDRPTHSRPRPGDDCGGWLEPPCDDTGGDDGDGDSGPPNHVAPTRTRTR
ncbi:hypothetical protein GCM10011581_20550 [Saccharopolyspora subtropica]|uniref:Penicillin-insensitive transglycosylase n=1 Tax=Saccharopolyspora thermophila TaxID=89367 RepID=A0A917JUR7_9PSEU|nr:transglycosylase domain-containing protein [Saccharopolyspora subtropica]GGI83182.1 hypothetical protein GCM10011581_20550 [Saccharopolyspora subtropica]